MKTCMSFALSATGQAVSISEVLSGSACNCTCAGCGEPLIAKKGKKRGHHFSHSSGSECAGGYESSLHLAVKTILERTKKIFLPDCIVQQSFAEREVFDAGGLRMVSELAFSYLKHDPRDLWKYPEQLDRAYPQDGYASVRGGLITFDTVAVEQRAQNIVPDIIGYLNGRPVYVEVAVTHFVDNTKMEKLRSHDVSTLELDFSAMKDTDLNWVDLEGHLHTKSTGRSWLWNQHANILADRDRQFREHRMASYLDEMAKVHVTHRSVFATGGMSEIRVTLCPSYVGVTLIGEFRDHRASKNFYEEMKAARGVYDKATNQWRLVPATEDYWLRVEGGLRHRYRAKHSAWTVTVPPAEKKRIEALMTGKALRA